MGISGVLFQGGSNGLGQAGTHFCSGSFGEGNNQKLIRIAGIFGVRQPLNDAGNQDSRFSGTGGSGNQNGTAPGQNAVFLIRCPVRHWFPPSRTGC